MEGAALRAARPPGQGAAVSYGSGAGTSKASVLLFDDDDRRRRFNSVAIILALLLPCGIFAGTTSLLSFSLGSEHKGLAAFLVTLGCLASLALGLKAALGFRRQARGDGGEREPTWFLFLAVTCFLAWLLGVILGKANYGARMRPYYDMEIMATARDVDPQDIPATKYMDAGRILFLPGSRVSEELSLGYKDGDLYCAAPIVLNTSQRVASYDFWAVGINCCSPSSPATFWCGTADTGDPDAHAGVRWTGSRENFARAIEQAEAEYGYKAMHPMLLTWTKDPVADVDALRTAGISFVTTAVLVHFIVQAAGVVLMVSAHSALGSRLAEIVRRTTQGEAQLDADPTQPVLGGSSVFAGYAGTRAQPKGWRM